MLSDGPGTDDPPAGVPLLGVTTEGWDDFGTDGPGVVVPIGGGKVGCRKKW